MNERAAYLGAHDTLAKDPAGLDVAGETSSAYDLALIGRAALQLKDFRRYVTTKQVDFPGRVDPKTKKRATYKINNHNKLLYNYPGTIGVKNGYTEAAHRTYISAVTRGGRTYLLTEMYGLDTSWRPQAAMYDWAFTYGARANSVGRLVDPGEVTTAPDQGSGADPNVAAPANAGRGSHNPAAAALPMASLLDRSVPPWAGAVGLAASLLLVLVLSRRGRRRVPHRPRH
jgi:D-alanyl-D-alanine carboxypeptidase (penicillin-binding protein 5/6)